MGPHSQGTRETPTRGTRQGATVLLRTKGRNAEQGGGHEQLQGPGAYPMGHLRVKMARADLSRVLNALVGSVEIGGVLFVCYFLWFS